MKKRSLLFLLGLLVLIGCKDYRYNKYTANVPVYTDFKTFRSSLSQVKFEPAKTVLEKGNIYFKDHYLFIIDNFKGIHIFDNSNPQSPIGKGYYSIVGITGLEIKGNNMYVNAYVDLVVIDVSNIENPKEVKRLENVFSYALPSHDVNYPISEIDPSKGIITGWKIEEFVSDKKPINGCFNCQIFFDGEGASFNSNTTGGASFNLNAGGSSNQGISGSITKFTLLNDYLYVMDGHFLKPFDLTSPTLPINTTKVQIWREVETLFSYNNHIFMGTTTGMLIYETSNRNLPTQKGVISHTNSCDPVVVDGDYAYVTLRTGSRCSGQVNQLDIIDVSDYSNPQLLKTYGLKNPHGLGIINNHLFICDGSAGLKIYDATNPVEAGDNKIKQFSKIQATDIILLNNIAMLIGDDGIYQYDITDIDNITEISKINFN